VWANAGADGVQAEIDAAAGRAPFGRDGDRLVDGVQVRQHSARRLSRWNDVLPPARYIRSYRRAKPYSVSAHSITSSACASSKGGTVSPSSFAVFMLITSSKRVGCITGSSVGFSPLRTRPA